MKPNLLMDFSVNKETSTIMVKREFAAGLPMVWDAFTKSELLDQWWAPRPWKARTQSMDFTEGGLWHYTMVGPAGEEHWCLAKYLSIQPQKNFTAIDAFSFPEGGINTEMPQSKWNSNFTQANVGSLVEIQITFDSLTQLETVLGMGFKEGLSAAMDHLDEIFEDN